MPVLLHLITLNCSLNILFLLAHSLTGNWKADHLAMHLLETVKAGY